MNVKKLEKGLVLVALSDQAMSLLFKNKSAQNARFSALESYSQG
jgi:hypothetical protein